MSNSTANFMDDSDENTPNGDFAEGADPLAQWHGQGPTESPLGIGTILLNRFQLLHHYGVGGQSQVWAAWEIPVRRFVVLKFVHARLLEEARRAANLSGNVIRVLEYNDTAIPDNPFLVLEPALGGPVSRLAKVWANNPSLLIEKFIPVVRTLVTAHAAGTIHRDLKPSNILLWIEPPPAPQDDTVPPLPDLSRHDAQAFILKIADWGLATGEGDSDSAHNGTPGFAAPEQWRFTATPAADVFGLAATLYYLLTGQHVMPASRDYALKLHLGAATYESPRPVHELNRNVDPRLSRIIMTSLAADPAARHSSADALANELQRWRTGYPIAGDNNSRKLRLWIRRNRKRVAAAVVAGLLVLAFAAWAVISTISDARSMEALALQEKETETARADRVTAELGRKRAEADRAHAEVREREAVLQQERNQRLSELILTARMAARRGDWPAALELTNHLIREVDAPLALRLRVERLFGYFATNNEPALIRELKLLENEVELDRLAPRVKLVRGSFLMCDVKRVSEGRLLIKQALDERKRIPDTERDELFPPADAMYGEALLEIYPQPMIDKLRETVKLDALHYPAHSALVFTLIAAGDPDGAMRQAELFGGLFPQSPVPALARAIRAVVLGDRPVMRNEVAEFAKKARVDARLLAAYLELFADVLHLMEKYNLRSGNLSPLDLGNLFLKVGEMRGIDAAAIRPGGFFVSNLSMFLIFNQEVTDLMFQGNRPPNLNFAKIAELDAEGNRLAELTKQYPEALIHCLYATNRFVGAAAAVKADQFEQSERRLLEAATAAYQAAEQPSIAPRTPVRYGARFVGVAADIGLLKMLPDAPAIHLRRVRDNLPILISEGRTWTEQRDDCVQMTIQLITATHSKALLAKWHLDQPDGAKAYRDRNRQLYVLGRSFLDSWADEVSTRSGKTREKTQAKLKELRTALQTWAEAERVTDQEMPEPPRPNVAPMERLK